MDSMRNSGPAGKNGVGVEKRSNRKKKRESKENNEKVVTIEVPIEETSETKDSEVEASDGEYGLSVGDFVWGKIKSHPWWPGRIYDPSDASEYALKLRQKNRLLVAYFGDWTFAWCHPSQLKPFEENFEDMVKQSNSKAFVNAVQDAVVEIGRLLDLRMTNSCVARKSKAEVASLLAKNSGIKDGVLVPEDGIEKLATVLFDPGEFLSQVKKIAEVIAMSSVLELEILKARLSAFYLFRGGYKLPNYHAPQPVPGLEDNRIDGPSDKGNRNETTVQGPFDEEHSLPASPKRGEVNHSSGTRSHHRRKQKSIAEIIREDNDLHTKDNDGVENEVVNSGKITGSSSGKRKMKRLEDTMTTTQVQKTQESPRSNDQNVPNSENGGSGGNQSTDEGPLSRLKKKKKNLGDRSAMSKMESDGARAPVIREGNLNKKEGKEPSEKEFLSRERKKSKYLSPPFTTPSRGQKKGDKEVTSDKDPSKTPISEKIARAAGELLALGTHTPLYKDGQTIHETIPKETAASQVNIAKKPSKGHDLSDKLNSQTPEEKNNTIDLKKVQASPREVMTEVRFAALNPQVSKDINFSDKIVGFVSVFRSSMYRQESLYTLFNKSQPGRKRKKLESEPGTLRKSQKVTDQTPSNHDSQKGKGRKKTDIVSDTPKEKPVSEKKTGKITDHDSQKGKRRKKTDTISNTPKEKPVSEKKTGKITDQTPPNHDSEKRKKRKRMDTVSDTPKKEPVSEKKTGKITDQTPPNHDSEKRKKRKKTDTVSDMPKKKPVSEKKRAAEKRVEENVSAAAFTMSFGSGSSLPSKSELLKLYSQFGALNEAETDVFGSSHTARVCFLKTSDAEVAFNDSKNASPFGCSDLKFEFSDHQVGSKQREDGGKSKTKASSSKKKDRTTAKPSASQSPIIGVSNLNFIKHKLEAMSEMLQGTEGIPSDMLKNRIESDIKGLLENVKKMAECSST